MEYKKGDVVFVGQIEQAGIGRKAIIRTAKILRGSNGYYMVKFNDNTIKLMDTRSIAGYVEIDGKRINPDLTN